MPQGETHCFLKIIPNSFTDYSLCTFIGKLDDVSPVLWFTSQVRCHTLEHFSAFGLSYSKYISVIFSLPWSDCMTVFYVFFQWSLDFHLYPLLWWLMWGCGLSEDPGIPALAPGVRKPHDMSISFSVKWNSWENEKGSSI